MGAAVVDIDVVAILSFVDADDGAGWIALSVAGSCWPDVVPLGVVVAPDPDPGTGLSSATGITVSWLLGAVAEIASRGRVWVG